MKRSKICLFCIIWFCFFYFTSFGAGLCYAAKAENERWSFDFKNCTVSDALREMTQVTGLNLFTNQNGEVDPFSKSYEDQTIDQILGDLFRKQNCAMVWYYGEKGLDSIGIWIFESSGIGGNFNPARFLKEKRASTKGNTIGRNMGSKSIVVRQQSPSGNRSFKTQIKTSSLGHSVSNHEIGKTTPAFTLSRPELDNQGTSVRNGGIAQSEDQKSGTVPPSPAPGKKHGLESPPMPPGFSYAK